MTQTHPEEEDKMRFDKRISVGNMLTLWVLLLGGLGFLYDTRAQINGNTEAIKEETSQVEEIEETVKTLELEVREIRIEQTHAKEDRQEIKQDVKDVLMILRQRDQ